MLIRYLERKLRLNGIRLEKLIAKRTQALSEAIDSKNKFFSIISHDLKNPIQSLQLVAHNLYQRFDQMQDVEKRTILRIIDETSGFWIICCCGNFPNRKFFFPTIKKQNYRR